MADRKINRDAWARLIDDLIVANTRGKKAPFARLVGVDPRTLSHWLASDVDVSEESVRAVARALNLSPRELLVQVGYYAEADFQVPAPIPPPRKVDRDEWARQVDQLIASETAGNKSKFALRVGVTYKTINRWLNSEVDVSEENVLAVARALSLPAGDLLFRVGYYVEADFAGPVPIPPPPGGGHDEGLDLIMGSDLPPHMKRRMIERLGRLRRAQQEREAEEVRWWIDQASGA